MALFLPSIRRLRRGQRIGSLALRQVIGGVAVGTALSAASISRTSGVSSYPMTAQFDNRPVDWFDGIFAVMQRSQDPTFTTGVSEAVLQVYAAVTSYNFGLSAIVSGVWYARLGAWSGTRPGSLNWSNIIGVGDAVAPTITSTATPSGFQSVAGSMTLTANKGVTWAIVGGLNNDQFTLAGNQLSWLPQAGIGSIGVQVQATSYFGVASTPQDITLTIAANTANAFSFTDVSNATLSTPYTSNTVTVAGIGSGSLPVTITGGTYSKNGGSYTSAAGTAVNGDTFSVRVTSSASNNAISNVVLTIGTTSDTYTVSTPVVVNFKWSTTDTNAGVARSNNDQTATISSGGPVGIRSVLSLDLSQKIYLEAVIGYSGSIGTISVGPVRSAASLSNYMGSDTNGAVILFQFGNANIFYNNAKPVGLGAHGAQPITLCLAIDGPNKRLAGKILGSVSGWNEQSQDLSAVTGYDFSALTGTLFIGFSSDKTGDNVTLRTATSQLQGTVPAGYTTLDV